MFNYKIILFIGIVAAIAQYSLNADQRSYIWTYEYLIMEPGKAEFEQYTTFSSPEMSDLKNNVNTELNFELEIGMNDYFDFGLYHNFTQEPKGNLSYSGFKLRSRYKIGEKDRFIIDPLIYIEYKGTSDFSKHAIETKFILAKDIGKLNIALNPYFEIEYEEEWKFKPKYAIGIGYHFFQLFGLAMEVKGSESGHYAGPTISHGKHDLWIALGSLFNLSTVDEKKPELMVRMIVGVEL